MVTFAPQFSAAGETLVSLVALPLERFVAKLLRVEILRRLGVD